MGLCNIAFAKLYNYNYTYIPKNCNWPRMNLARPLAATKNVVFDL